jgi:hypothetical protein
MIVVNIQHIFTLSKEHDKSKLKLKYTGVPELADQTYSAFSLVITESNSVLKKGQGITDFL